MEELCANDRYYEPKNDVILQTVAKILVPPIFIFGIYVILCGHSRAGGGFSGGAIIGAGLILYLNAFGFEKDGAVFLPQGHTRSPVLRRWRATPCARVIRFIPARITLKV